MIASDDIKLLFKWLKIREFNGSSFPNDVDGLFVTANKSSLLDRMLKGKDPLLYPPPKSFSYPWYDLMETGEGYPLDVSRTEGMEKDIFGDAIIINQSVWILLREEGPEDWIVTYEYGPHMSKITFDGEWRVNKQENGSWLIKRIK